MHTKIKLLHTSDWHLGRSLYGQSLLEDQAHALEQLIQLVDKSKPDAVLIAGDIFDRSLPPESAVKLFDWFLNEVALIRKTQVVLIPGNHDSKERVGFASSLLRDQRVTIFGSLADANKPVLICNAAGGKVWIYGIPFVEPMEIGEALGRDDLRTPDQATRIFCEALLEGKTDDIPAVLLCHAFVTGGEVSESEKEIYIGGSSQVDAAAFTGFVYTALGHLHKPQRAGRDHVRYSGSLLPYSKSEIGHDKSITEINIDMEGTVEITTHLLDQKRQLRYVEGELATLIENGLADPVRDDYMIAGFTDDGAVLDAFAKLRTVYPQLLHISRAGGFRPNLLPGLAQGRESLSDFELFTEFFNEASGSQLNEAEKSVLIEVLKESK